MRWFRLIVLYTALALGANTALAQPAALREGTLLKLVFHEAPKEVPGELALRDLNGRETRLADYAGRIVLVNFWATWCAPCRKEMPALDALRAELEGEDFSVVTIAVGRHAPGTIARFFEEIGISELAVLRDPRQELAREMGILALPTTVILDRDGQEIARLQGDAEWDGDSARAIIAALMAQG